MDEKEQRDEERWNQMSESMEMLFTKVAEIDANQQKMDTRFDMTTKVLEQMLKDQQLMVKQIENTGKAVAQLTIAQMESRIDPPSPTSSEASMENPFHQGPKYKMGSSKEFKYGGMAGKASEGEDKFHNRIQLPKMSFPKFTGTNPCIWKDKCENYFKIFDIPSGMWATYASMNMDENTSRWLQVYKKQNGLGDWKTFIKAVEKKFGANDYRESLTKLLELHQTESLETYISTFEDLQYQITMINSELGDLFFVTQFIKGLKMEIGSVVQAQIPETMQRAILLARIQQQVLDRGKTRNYRTAPAFKQIQQSVKNDTKTGNQANGLWKERQTRDYRRANGLCYFCAEPYDGNHRAVCPKRPQQQPQVNALALNDLDVELTEEVLNQLAIEDAITDDLCNLSLNAISGTANGEVLQVRALVNNKVMLILIDSGSSHSFVSDAFLQTVSIQPVPTAARQVKLANGEIMITDQWVPELHWWADGQTLQSDMKVLPLGVYDAILGYDWLSSHSPMQCHWDTKTIHFVDKGRNITLKGVQPPAQPMAAMPVEQLWKCCQGNDVWALAIVETLPLNSSPGSDKAEVQELLKQYEDVFQAPTTLPPARVYDHQIPLLPNSVPVNSRPYRYSPQHKDEIEKQVRELLQAGLITHSTSPFASPVLLVLKKDGSWRFCVDYRKLNSMTIKNRFPMPLIDEILDELAGTKYFTKLDMRSGYHQVRMQEKDEYKTAFKTHQGHYQFKVMPFGLTNAPATFQCIMNEVLAPFLRKFVMVFLDDILVYSHTLEEHLKHLALVLQKLRDHKLYMKATKCSFAQSQLEYLGHIISVDGVATDPAKTEDMLKWPTPTSVTELRGFLGLTGYYRKFVRNYGIMAKPLTQLLRKNQFQWSDQAQQAFEALKQAMSSTPVLALPDFSKPFIIETDACDVGIGAVLMQGQQPVAFLSKALSSQHKHLSIYEKEFLALIMAVDKWRQYLQHQEFIIKTDHKSLEYLTQQNLHSEMQRKAMARLMGLQFKVVYRKGIENTVADALSRVHHLCLLQAVSSVKPSWIQELLNAYATDAKAQQLLAQLSIKSPDDKGFSLDQGLIRFQGKLWVAQNSALQTKLISVCHASAVGGHSGVNVTYHRMNKLFHWKGLKQDVEDFIRQCDICQQAKHLNALPSGLLQPLPIPAGAWQDISMDFIEGLPKSEGYSVILVIVDRFTKFAHFVPLRHPYTAKTVAKLVFDQVVSLHGLPKTIVSDRDKVFTSTFWKELFSLMGTLIVLSSAYHPQTDGQTERVNQCLEMYLRCSVYKDPKQWKSWLPRAQFWYNSSHHSSIGCSPFYALYGHEPNLGLVPTVTDTTSPSVADTVAELQAQATVLKEQLAQAQNKMKTWADKHRRPQEYQVGERVLLKLQPYAQSSLVNRPFPKLAFKYFGPYSVLERVGKAAYKLELPEDALIHPVFHVSQLKPFHPNYTPVFSDLPTTADLNKGEIVPEKVLQRRLVKKGGKAVPQALIKWSTLPEEASTWEDWYVVKQRFPEHLAGGPASSEGGEDVTTTPTT
jgi:hypothetical protein